MTGDLWSTVIFDLLGKPEVSPHVLHNIGLIENKIENIQMQNNQDMHSTWKYNTQVINIKWLTSKLVKF